MKKAEARRDGRSAPPGRLRWSGKTGACVALLCAVLLLTTTSCRRRKKGKTSGEGGWSFVSGRSVMLARSYKGRPWRAIMLAAPRKKTRGPRRLFNAPRPIHFTHQPRRIGVKDLFRIFRPRHPHPLMPEMGPGTKRGKRKARKPGGILFEYRCNREIALTMIIRRRPKGRWATTVRFLHTHGKWQQLKIPFSVIKKVDSGGSTPKHLSTGSPGSRPSCSGKGCTSTSYKPSPLHQEEMQFWETEEQANDRKTVTLVLVTPSLFARKVKKNKR